MVQRKQDGDAGAGAVLTPLGARAEVVAALADSNTAHDGSPRQPAATSEFLYGPGLIAELPLEHDPVTQVMVQVNDVDVAWPVLSRLCKKHGWQMVDVESGQTFG